MTGRAAYSADRDEPGTVHAHLVTAKVATGTVTAMDVAAAEAAPGVLAVFTPFRRFAQPLYVETGVPESYVPFQDDRVRYHGQVIGLVVAETVEQARDAAALVRTTYAATTARTTLADHLPGGPVPAPPTFGEVDITHLQPGTATIDDALAASEVVVGAEYRQGITSHVPMEPHAALAVWHHGRLTVHSGQQRPTEAVRTIAARLGIAAADVRVICEYTGGGFGARVLTWNDAVLAAAAAREVGRPVKLAFTREQVFTTTPHRSASVQTVRLGARRDGTLTALAHEADSEISAVGGWPLLPASSTSGVLYGTPNLHVRQRAVPLDLPPVWAMRGPHEAPGAFALETAMDELAVATGVDPVELRLRNPTDVEPATGLPFSSKHLDECLRLGARRFGWSRRRPEPRSQRDGDWLVGSGMASAVYPGARWPTASARVEFRADGTVEAATTTPEIGTGVQTLVAITAADALGVPLRQVQARVGDTALPAGGNSSASNGASTTVATVQVVAASAVRRLLELAVSTPGLPWSGDDVATVRYEAGRVVGGGASRSFREVVRAARVPSVGATERVDADPALRRWSFHCFGAHFCEVAVHRLTAEVRVRRFTTVVDVGRVVNARAARSQIRSSVVFGIGHALLEDVPIEPGTGRMAAANLADYVVPVNADVPDLDVRWLDRPDPVLNAAGVRGLAELGTVGSAAAVGNAVFHATGTRVRDLPITVDKLL